MRLIDADALVARFSLWLEDDNYADGNTYADIAEDFIIPSINEAETIEELLPFAQHEIIWCKDCRFNDGVAYCEMHLRDVKGNDFCSWAEVDQRRKEKK